MADTPAHPPRTAAVVAAETLEDYTLRYAPRSYRRWSPAVVAITALGGIAYLADFSIGAGIALAHGTVNALLAIAFAAALIFVTGLPLAYYGARYNIDLDLITRGAGFGYYGSVLTSVIFASFTFIFFALEGSIMAQGLQLGLGLPLWLGYLVSTVLVIPLVIYGMRALSRMQVWTTPIWLVLMIGPIVFLLWRHPESFGRWLDFQGAGPGKVSLPAVMLGAGVALSLMGQIGEQIDYLRFMPPRTAANRRAWWTAVLAAGPGWVILGALKQAIGAFLAVYILAKVGSSQIATEPVRQFVGAFDEAIPGWPALLLAVLLVVISQIKINVTNAYSGSLAWTNAYTRVTGRYPGRMIFVLVNLAFALILMEANMFAFLNALLGFYSNCAIAWVVTVASDIVFNKYLLGLSPKEPEFRRGMLYAFNPVGLVSFLLSAGLSIAAYFGLLGNTLASYSPIIAVVLALLVTPLMAIATRGRYYLRRSNDGIAEPRFESDGTPAATLHVCCVCEQALERPDVLHSPRHAGIVCSLCLATTR